MRVRANHRRDPPVQMPAQCDFFRSRLHVRLHQNRVALPCDRRNFLVSHAEGAAVRLHAHEVAPEHGEEPQTVSAPLQHNMTAARVASREVGRAADPGKAFDLVLEVLLVPDVVAQGNGINPAGEQFLRDLAGDARPARGILPVGHDKIGGQLFPQGRQALQQEAPAGTPHDITEKKQLGHDRRNGRQGASRQACSGNDPSGRHGTDSR